MSSWLTSIQELREPSLTFWTNDKKLLKGSELALLIETEFFATRVYKTILPYVGCGRYLFFSVSSSYTLRTFTAVIGEEDYT